MTVSHRLIQQLVFDLIRPRSRSKFSNGRSRPRKAQRCRRDQIKARATTSTHARYEGRQLGRTATPTVQRATSTNPSLDTGWPSVEFTMAKTKQVNKSAKDGKFVSDKAVKKSPNTTYKQTVPTKGKKSKK